MTQAKQNKRLRALERLQAESQALQAERESLQCQTYGLIAPCETELRIAQEINRVKYNLGLPAQVSESPF